MFDMIINHKMKLLLSEASQSPVRNPSWLLGRLLCVCVFTPLNAVVN